MCRLASVHLVTDGQTDNSVMPIADHTAWDRLKKKQKTWKKKIL